MGLNMCEPPTQKLFFGGSMLPHGLNVPPELPVGLCRVQEPPSNDLWPQCTFTHLEEGTTCFEEQKLQASLAKNKELQDMRLDANMFCLGSG